MKPARILGLAAAFFCFSLVPDSSSAAQDEKPVDPNIKQKKAVESNLKQGKVTMTVAESAELRLVSAYSTEKAEKILGEAQKAYAAAIKVLGYEGKDDPIPGKLTLYAFTEAKLYKAFLLQALKRAPRGRSMDERDLKGDVPHIVLNGAATTDKPTEASLTAQLARAAASALLSIKSGMTDETSLPNWLDAGFAENAVLRAEGNATKLAAFKAKVKALATKSRGAALQLRFVWGEGVAATPEAELVAHGFVDYLVYGPGAEKFPMILTALKPAEGNDEPSVPKAFAAADWKMEDAEAAWRKWVLTGK